MDSTKVWKGVIQNFLPETQEALNEFILREIDKYQERLITSDDLNNTRLYQGAIRALRSLLDLRKKAEERLKNGTR